MGKLTFTDAVHIRLCYYLYGKDLFAQTKKTAAPEVVTPTGVVDYIINLLSNLHWISDYLLGEVAVEDSDSLPTRIQHAVPIMNRLLDPTLDTDKKLADNLAQYQAENTLPRVLDEKMRDVLSSYKNEIEVGDNRRPKIQAHQSQPSTVNKSISRFFTDPRQFVYEERGIWEKPGGVSEGYITCKRIETLSKQKPEKFLKPWLIKAGHNNISGFEPEYVATISHEVFAGSCYRQILGASSTNPLKFRRVKNGSTLPWYTKYQVASKIIPSIEFEYDLDINPKLVSNLIRNVVAVILLGVWDAGVHFDRKTHNFGIKHEKDHAEMFFLDFGDCKIPYESDDLKYIKDLLSDTTLTMDALHEQWCALAKSMMKGWGIDTTLITHDHVVKELQQLCAIDLEVIREIAKHLQHEKLGNIVIKNLGDIQELILNHPLIFADKVEIQKTRIRM